MGDRVVNLDLSQGFTLSGTMTPTGTSGSVSYYCCSNGSARVIVLDSTGQRLSIVIPNHGTNTIHGPFYCIPQNLISYIVSVESCNTATGSFTISC